MSVTAERLRQLRDERGSNQKGIAKAVKLSQTTYSDWETNPPRSLEHLRRFCEYYHVSADYLLGLVDDPEGRRGLSPELLELSLLWGSLDDGQRRLVMDTMKMLARVRTPHIIGDEEDKG